jgi:hypothetical protein
VVKVRGDEAESTGMQQMQEAGTVRAPGHTDEHESGRFQPAVNLKDG